MNLDIRKIKNTTYRIVFSNFKIVGMLDGERYIGVDNLTPNMKKEADLYHAATFKDRLLEVNI